MSVTDKTSLQKETIIFSGKLEPIHIQKVGHCLRLLEVLQFSDVHDLQNEFATVVRYHCVLWVFSGLLVEKWT